MKKEFTVHLIAKKGMHTLQRITGLFSQKQCSITSLYFTEAEEDTTMTVIAVGDQYLKNHIFKQLHKLYDIKKISEL